MFGGWTVHNVPFVAVFVHYIHKGIDQQTIIVSSSSNRGAQTNIMLACAPLIDEEDLSAKENITVLEETVEVYGKEVGNVMCFIGDNWKVNRSLSSQTNIPLVGCYSHKFNLAIERWITT